MKQADVKFMHPRTQIVRVMSHFKHNQMTTTACGNISIMDKKGGFRIIPSAIDKGTPTKRNNICVTKGRTIEGKCKPLSGYTFHKTFFNVKPEINTVINSL